MLSESVYNYFLLIFEPCINSDIENRLSECGQFKKILGNVYTLTIKSDNVVKIVDVRDSVSKSDVNVFVLRLTEDTSAAWRLSADSANRISDCFSEISKNRV